MASVLWIKALKAMTIIRVFMILLLINTLIKTLQAYQITVLQLIEQNRKILKRLINNNLHNRHQTPNLRNILLKSKNL